MIAWQKNLFFSVSAMGLMMILCDANLIINNEISKENKYAMDVEILKHIDRFHSTFRRAEVWELYEDSKVRSHFNIFIDDDNVKELKHYMNFIGTSGPFLDNLTILYSILYSKYKAVFYSMNLLNIYAMKKEEFKFWDHDETIHEILKENKPQLLDIYLKVGQYLAWYAYIGNDILQKTIHEKLEEKIPCAVDPFNQFMYAFSNFLREIDTKIFKDMNSRKTDDKSIIDTDKYVDEFWRNIHKNSKDDIKIMNKYFTAVLYGIPTDNINVNDFVQTVKKETFIATFVSDLFCMKGRDIEETYSNFDNKDKKELHEANITNMIMVIENKIMESISGISTKKVDAEKKKDEKIDAEVKKKEKVDTEVKKKEKIDAEVKKKEKIYAERKKKEKIDAEEKKQYVVLQSISSEKLYTCLQFRIVPKEIFLSKTDRALKRESLK